MTTRDRPPEETSSAATRGPRPLARGLLRLSAIALTLVPPLARESRGRMVAATVVRTVMVTALAGVAVWLAYAAYEPFDLY